MLTKLRIKNFKIWGQQIWDPGIDLAPVTLFLGPNSAGKTSLIQLPLLMKQTFDSPDRKLALNLRGQPTGLVDLGSYESLIHGHHTDRELGIGLSCQSPKVGDDRTLEYEATYTSVSAAPVLQRLQLKSDDRVFAATRHGKGGYLLDAPGYTPRDIGNRPDARRTYQPERSITFSPDAIAELAALGPELQDLALLIRQAIANVVYLGPLRKGPERSYPWNGVEPGELGNRGEQTIDALLASVNARTKQKNGQEGGRQWLLQQVSAWMKRLGIADEMRLDHEGKSRHYEVTIVRGRQRANIMDVGFGISQVLPMLVLAYFVPQGTTIIAEQPEIHLHPRAQVGLAELMVEVSRHRRIQFLVETHSEHLFRRLQSLIADEKIAADDCRLYFIDRGHKGGTQLAELKLDTFGRVSNWPKQFFGDTIGETERQTRTMIKRLAHDRKGTTT